MIIPSFVVLGRYDLFFFLLLWGVTSLGNKGRIFKSSKFSALYLHYICIKLTYIWPNPDENDYAHGLRYMEKEN